MAKEIPPLETIIKNNCKENDQYYGQDPYNLILEDSYDVAQQLAHSMLILDKVLRQVKDWDEEDRLNIIKDIKDTYPDSPVKSRVMAYLDNNL